MALQDRRIYNLTGLLNKGGNSPHCFVHMNGYSLKEIKQIVNMKSYFSFLLIKCIKQRTVKS